MNWTRKAVSWREALMRNQLSARSPPRLRTRPRTRLRTPPQDPTIVIGTTMIGFQIKQRTRKVDADTVSKFSVLPVANISDSMSRMTAGGPSLRPMDARGVLAGPAFTVKTRPGDNLMLHKAIDIAEPGDVIIVDGGGDLTNSLIGEMMSAQAERRGIAGMVIYGSIRDYDTIHAGRYPIFAAGVTHRGPYKDGPGEINVPIAIDGMVIEPGDLIVGDGDGVVCVPFAQTADVLKATEAK